MSLSKNATLLEWLSAFLPPITWAVLIFLLSAQSNIPGPEVVVLDFVFKKTAHIFVYSVLYVLLYRAVRMTFARSASSSTRSWLLPMLICFVYAASDELHQSMVMGRTSTIRDVGYDMLGVLVSFLAIHRYL